MPDEEIWVLPRNKYRLVSGGYCRGNYHPLGFDPPARAVTGMDLGSVFAPPDREWFVPDCQEALQKARRLADLLTKAMERGVSPSEAGTRPPHWVVEETVATVLPLLGL